MKRHRFVKSSNSGDFVKVRGNRLVNGRLSSLSKPPPA